MPISVPTVNAEPVATSADEPDPQDGWRNGGLTALRAELDRIDNAIHDLLIQRAQVVEHVARSGKPAAFRPGREASIIRRLLSSHRGSLPPVTLVRIWREMLAGTTAMQGSFSLAVADTDASGLVSQLAREHFGALTPLRLSGSPGQALADVRLGRTNVAVLPYPSEADPWWLLLSHHEPRLHIIARLPFWQPRPEGVSSAQALVIAAITADASGDDGSFLGLECDANISRNGLFSQLTAAGFRPKTVLLRRSPGSPVASILIEVQDFIDGDDPRLTKLEPARHRPVILGHYAEPVGGAAS